MVYRRKADTTAIAVHCYFVKMRFILRFSLLLVHFAICVVKTSSEASFARSGSGLEDDASSPCYVPAYAADQGAPKSEASALLCSRCYLACMESSEVGLEVSRILNQLYSYRYIIN